MSRTFAHRKGYKSKKNKNNGSELIFSSYIDKVERGMLKNVNVWSGCRSRIKSALKNGEEDIVEELIV